jgi:hypothetical protein
MRIGRRSFVFAAAASVARPAFADPVTAAPGPRTLIEFLWAMKRAAEEGALLDPAFYDEANLKRLFAARVVTFGRPLEGYRLFGGVSGFGVLVEPVKMAGVTREGMTLDFSLSTEPAYGRLQLTFLRPAIAFGEIEGSFGKRWDLGAYPARPDGSPPLAERAHGNTAIRYGLGDAPARWMEFAFNPRALVESATVGAR